MKKIIYIIVIAIALPVLSGCEDFLDSKSFTTKDAGSFPKSPEDANQMLTGVYAQFNQISPGEDYMFYAEFFSDERFGGGGENDQSWQALNHLMYFSPDQFSGYWSKRYVGIARANEFLEAMERMEDFDGKTQKIGEAKFLRANWYFELVQMMGDVPLILAMPKSAAEAVKIPPRASQEEVYKQIATDLWEAYSEMTEDVYTKYESGRATKWAAAGLIARVYLFYTGFYGKDALPREGGTISKADAIAVLENCMAKSGHDLLTDFRQLWSYSNTATAKEYPYVADMVTNGLVWLEGSANKEVIFVTKFSNMGTWDSGMSNYSNQMITCNGVRSQNNYESIFPMTEGWGAGPVNTNFWDKWKVDDPQDIRRVASIYSVEEEALDPDEYTWGGDSQMEETGLWQKKLNAIGAHLDNGTLLASFMTHPDYVGGSRYTDYQLEHGTDIIRIRFADILLMHSELTGTADGMNKVRARVGLPPVTYSLPAIQKERQYELCFEALRWGDIRRWGIAEDVLGNIYGVAIKNNERPTVMKPQSPGGVVQRYKDTKCFMNIPQREIDLSNGEYKQNAGWDIPSANFVQWVD